MMLGGLACLPAIGLLDNRSQLAGYTTELLAASFIGDCQRDFATV